MSEYVSTGCGPIDDLLGGGLERGAVTQVYGPPAAGKTNLGLSAALDVAAGGDAALYIDTEGLSADRLRQVAAGRAAGTGQTVDDLAGRLIVSEVLDYDEQAEAVQDAAEFAAEVELVVLDSATGFYRLRRTDDDGGETLRDVARQITHLLSLARKHDIAVLFTNQVFTDPDSDRSTALGGHTLNHWSGAIIRLDRYRGGNRRATLEKHRAKPAGDTAQFSITDEGLVSADGPDAPR
ncbi:DNA repair and recombination protein RadB [Halomicroarcula sp. GCM10025324]|uniref:DNA repair and recombination protein RadB n=1 Tax=Haloarcula TaxID=2237 RepID=UPI0023E8C933|nr:DNA repair and recombination protein RadB [Halomicroarcula sp. ZS-22-S1]